MLVCSLAVLCVISRVLSQGKCPPLVEYMYSFGKYYPVCTTGVIIYQFFFSSGRSHRFVWCVLPSVSYHGMRALLIIKREETGSSDKSRG